MDEGEFDWWCWWVQHQGPSSSLFLWNWNIDTCRLQWRFSRCQSFAWSEFGHPGHCVSEIQLDLWSPLSVAKKCWQAGQVQLWCKKSVFSQIYSFLCLLWLLLLEASFRCVCYVIPEAILTSPTDCCGDSDHHLHQTREGQKTSFPWARSRILFTLLKVVISGDLCSVLVSMRMPEDSVFGADRGNAQAVWTAETLMSWGEVFSPWDLLRRDIPWSKAELSPVAQDVFRSDEAGGWC